MTYWLSSPIETLLPGLDRPDAAPVLETDTLIVGSGYGAAMAALALAEKLQGQPDASITVFERGDEYLPDDFPKSMNDLPGYVDYSREPVDGRKPRERSQNGLWDIRTGTGMTVVAGNGLGGGSLINGNVAARPDPAVVDKWPLAPGEAPWSERLHKVFPKIEELLGVSAVRNPERYPKYRALEKVVRELGGELGPAPVTINLDGPTAHSTDHGPCNACGNCVLGCHSGAKGSLNMNAWPLAVQMGVKLYTGVAVVSIEKDADGWLVRCRRSAAPRATPDPHLFAVRTRQLILAAGTLGSVEILKRSSRNGFSAALGKRFSANGDALLFGVGQRERVNPTGLVPHAGAAGDAPGPTIIGKGTIPLRDLARTEEEQVTLEEGAVPYPFIRLWQEMITTQSFLNRYSDAERSAWHKENPRHDYLAVSQGLADHSQVLLAMGLDEGDGELRLNTTTDRILPCWTLSQHSGEAVGYYHRLHDRFQQKPQSFDGGQFHPSPNWQLISKGFAENFEGGEAIARNLVTVHPLGGCRIANSPSLGVVNTRGQVYDADGHVHENLYVLDGSIIPGAIGTNPFLTIAALSYTLASQIVSEEAAVQSFPHLMGTLRLIPPGALRETPQPENDLHEAVFRERLVYSFSNDGRSLSPWAEDPAYSLDELNKILAGVLEIPATAKALVIDISFRFEGETALNFWLQKPDMPLRATLELKADTQTSILTTTTEHLVLLAKLDGEVVLGARAATDAAGRLDRRWKAARRFLSYRLDVQEALLAALRKKPGAGSGTAAGRKKPRSGLGYLRGWFRTLALHQDWREFRYEFRGSAIGDDPTEPTLVLRGTKTLGYGSERNPFGALLMLPVRLVNRRSGRQADLSFEVDSVGISEGPAPLQLLKIKNAPDALMSVAGLGLYFLRVIMQTHLWSFAAPDYSEYLALGEQDNNPVNGRMAPPPECIHYRQGTVDAVSTPRETYTGNADAPNCRLIRYQPRQPDPSRKVLLLIHGLAHSSRVFWTETIDENFVQYFLGRNYDVWILDHRTSANTIKQVEPDDTWDDIALHDVPWAVRQTYEVINSGRIDQEAKKIHLFGHCIGAGAASIAVLAGRLQAGTDSMLASFVPHAVTPWLYASVSNRARENIWGLIKNLKPLDTVEPRPHDKPSQLEIIYDRLASAGLTDKEKKQWQGQEGLLDPRGPGFARTIYTRYTIFWGRQWMNGNIAAATRMQFPGMIGAVPQGILQQVYFSITHGMLAENHGRNIYVRREKFRDNWTFPTLFLHGDRNSVFDMESSRLSADQLTRLRILERTGTWPEVLSPQDYARNRVWIEIVEDFGHMDMIFGKNASDRVFPLLDRFFSAADENTMTARYLNDFTSADGIADFRARRGCRSHTSPLADPLTGPIISRPRMSEDRAVLRIWCEGRDYSVREAQTVSVAGQENGSGLLERLDFNVLPEDGYSYYPDEFFFSDYTFDPGTPPGRFMMAYTGGTAVPTLPHPEPGARISTLLDWSALPWYQRALLKKDAGEVALSFVAGSCIHPGSTFEREAAYSIFDGIFTHVAPDQVAQKVRGIDHVLLLGDQIYADATAGLFDPDTAYERFRRAHRRMLGSPGARRLFAHVPAYFAVDDHEFEDNFHGDDGGGADDTQEPMLRTGKGPAADRPNLDNARIISGLYQVHRPATEGFHLWYDYESAGYPFFVFDTRLERNITTARTGVSACIGQLQQEAFSLWLQNSGSGIIFIATGAPLAPISRAIKTYPALMRHDDSLLGYPGFVSWLVQEIDANARGKTIYWLCGDPHFSCTAHLTLSTAAATIRVVQICASGMYSPYAFANANPNDYFIDGELSFDLSTPLADGDSLHIKGRQHLITASTQHFLRADLITTGAQPELRLQAFAADGTAISNRMTV